MKIEYGNVNVEIPDEVIEKLESLAMKLDMQLEHIQKEYPLPEGCMYFISEDNKLRIGLV